MIFLCYLIALFLSWEIRHSVRSNELNLKPDFFPSFFLPISQSFFFFCQMYLFYLGVVARDLILLILRSLAKPNFSNLNFFSNGITFVENIIFKLAVLQLQKVKEKKSKIHYSFILFFTINQEILKRWLEMLLNKFYI